jgi:hypothetical protein
MSALGHSLPMHSAPAPTNAEGSESGVIADEGRRAEAPPFFRRRVVVAFEN